MLTENGRATEHALYVDTLSALVRIDRDFEKRGLGAITADQSACLFDDARASEALAMIDDWEERCGADESDIGDLRVWLTRNEVCEQECEHPDIVYHSGSAWAWECLHCGARLK